MDENNVNKENSINKDKIIEELKEKEKNILDHESKYLIDELSRMPPMVIATAYLHAINYTLYGEDVTEKWATAVQNASALEKAYREGYHDAMQIQSKRDKETIQKLYNYITDDIETLKRETILDSIRAELTQAIQNGVIKIESGTDMLFCIIDKYKSESDEQTTENKCDTMVKEIREYCEKNYCAACEAFTRFGCIFKSGFHPDQWITTKEAEGDIFLNRRIK